MEQILANSTWPDRANRMCILKVENHIIHSKSAVSCRSVKTGKKKINDFFIPPDFKLKMLSYHFPRKVVPSWLHAGFKRLSVCIGWKLNERAKYEEKKNTFSVIKYKIVLFLCVVGQISLVLECRCGIINKCGATRDLFSSCGINTDMWSLRGLHSSNSSPFTLWHWVHMYATHCVVGARLNHTRLNLRSCRFCVCTFA